MSSVVRWQLLEVSTGDTYTVEVNPNQMGNYNFSKNLRFSLHGDGRVRGLQTRREPSDWSFSGVLQRKSQHDALVDWAKRRGKIRVTDHLGRTFEAMVKNIDMRDRRSLTNGAYRFRYTFNTLLLRRLS